MGSKVIVVNEINQSQKDKYYMVPLTEVIRTGMVGETESRFRAGRRGKGSRVSVWGC